MLIGRRRYAEVAQIKGAVVCSLGCVRCYNSRNGGLWFHVAQITAWVLYAKPPDGGVLRPTGEYTTLYDCDPGTDECPWPDRPTSKATSAVNPRVHQNSTIGRNKCVIPTWPVGQPEEG